MFRQILVHPEDTDYQRILWRSTKTQPVQDYRALTVTYGTAPAPFLALRVLQQLAADERERYPEGARLLDHRVYVDDLFGGGDAIDEAIDRRNQLIKMMMTAGMELGKWSANEAVLLRDIAADNGEKVSVELEDVVSTLGLKWCPRSDEFLFVSSLAPMPQVITKRNILSDVAKLFDPLGWLAEIREKVIKKEDTMLARLTKYSSFLKLTRVLGYCGRWLSRTRARRSNSASQMRPFLTLSELRWAKIACYKVIQREYYSTEISLMKQGKALPKRSNLRSLTPFIDREGIIRLGGRLQNSPLSFGERHPVILPGSCEIVRRLISGIHKLTLHGGVQLMLSQLHREYWITGARRIVVGLYRDCVKCARYRAQTGRQQMAPLPAERLIPQRPFASTGLDYAGPVSVLFSRGRGAKSTKGYVAIFVCLVVKAVHIEIVSDLTTDAFLAAYARFVARRGVCTRIYSDNATTFKKASTELARMFTEASDFYSTVTERLASRGTEWTFIPPRAPHFGGLWEAAVKSFKYHFKRIIGDTPMTFEELSTLAAQIEACLNSRPLCRQSDCPDDLVALTPGHFLVGSAYLIQLEKCEKDQRRSLNERWRLIVQLRNSFWVRWRKEVLNQLQQHNKWYDQHENFKIGDMVLVKDELSPPARWPLGLVTEVHPGKDGLVRVVTIKTASSQLMRPIVKLVKLPLDQDAQECINEDSA